MKSKKPDKINSNSCCSSGCCSHKLSKVKKQKCPACSEKGLSVKLETVKSMIKKNKKVPLKEDFYICENPDCDILYFSGESAFYKKDSIIEADFKKGTKTKYACYCNKLTYEEVEKALKKNKRTDWAFIVKEAKGKMAKCDCLHKNPYGKCCTSNSFKKAVEKAGFKFKGGC